MRARLLVALTALILPACGIDFIAVEDGGPSGLIVLRSEHGEVVEASLDVRFSRRESPPLVLMDGVELEAEEDGDFWLYEGTPVVDTLQPRLELEIQAEQGVVLTIPLVMRSGPAIWRPNGDLEIPLAYGGDGDGPEENWRVLLLDSDARQSLALDSRGAPLPRPIVLPAGLIPTGATTAEITVGLNLQLTEFGYPVAVSIRSTVNVPIPDAG